MTNPSKEVDRISELSKSRSFSEKVKHGGKLSIFRILFKLIFLSNGWLGKEGFEGVLDWFYHKTQETSKYDWL